MKFEHILDSNLFNESSPSVLQLTTPDNVHSMLTIVENIRQQFESSALKVLYYMKDNPKYVCLILVEFEILNSISQVH